MKKQGEIRKALDSQMAIAVSNYVLGEASYDVLITIRSSIGHIFGFGSVEYESASEWIEHGKRLKDGQPFVGVQS